MPVTTPEDAQIGYGTTVAYRVRNTTTPGTWLPLGTLVSVDGPNRTRGKVDITRLADAVKRSANLRAEKEITLNVQHCGTDKGCQDFEGWADADPSPTIDLQVVFPDGEGLTFYGIVNSYAISGVDGESVMMGAIGFPINSVITVTKPGSTLPV